MVKPLNNLYDSSQIEDALVKVNEDSSLAIVIVNTSDRTCELKCSTLVEEAVEAEVVHISTEKTSGNKEVVEKQGLLILFSASVNSSQESVERTKWR